LKRYKVLSIKGAVLDRHQLEKYLEQLASDHVLKNKSDKETYPIPRLRDNFETILDVYNLLNEHIKLKIPIHPAGEWILDNFYVIEETVKAIEKEITLKKYTRFLGIGNGTYAGFARIYALASEIVAYTDNKIEAKNLTDYLRAYQTKKTLSMEEIWSLGVFLQIAIIENIRNICEKIYSSQMQKYRVENIIERLVENKAKEDLAFKNLGEYKTRVKEAGDVKYTFIEYMSYRLKMYGKKAYPFLEILEEQVNKMGNDISEIIKKEHFEIAVKKVSIGNSITSIKTLQRINFIDIFEEINKVDDILKLDPAEVYSKMDYKTKIYYRNKIEQLSKKTKISEIYIAQKCLELAKNKYDRQKEILEELENKLDIAKENMNVKILKKIHVGYYLISEGKSELLEALTNKKKICISKERRMWIYIVIKTILTLVISTLLSLYINTQLNNFILSVLLGVLVYVPIENLVVQVMQYILSKTTKPKLIPKLDLSKGISREASTFVVIPTILKDSSRVEELIKKLEIYYLANKSNNIYFALLGDCTSGDKQDEAFDNDVIQAGIKYTEQLNEKYPSEQFPRFHFIYRNRVWNDKEGCYLGWERKRGLLNQFNEYLLGKNKNEFKENTIEKLKQKNIQIPNIKYIITLDSDTELTLNSGLELIGAMSHILNVPIMNYSKNRVIDGYGIMQPHIGINLQAARKTLFTKIYSGISGTDSYTNATSDVYQDNFEEGIFTGKGIYNLKVFSQVLDKQIAENTVLSHDLLEGNYLRCGLASDIMLMDGYPTNYNSFKTRQHRWIRGDWQIIRWLKYKIKDTQGRTTINPLNVISKYKILDNLVRSIFIPLILICFIYICILYIFYKIKIWPIIFFLLITVASPIFLEVLNKIIYKQNRQIIQKTFNKHFNGLKGILARLVLEIGTIPDKAYMCLNAICKTLYRVNVSKQHLLEWMTAEEAEKQAKNTVKAYYKNMLPNVIISVIGFVILFFKFNILIFVLSSIWLITPLFMYYISKPEEHKKQIEKISEPDKEYVLEIARRTWRFFKDNLNEKNNYLPPDNYQEDRIPQIVQRTSSTNIGLALLAVVSSYDLGFESLEYTIDMLQKMLDTISKLQKWNGHLYNWYNIENLEPLNPKYVSTVDSGNFIGYLYVLKQFLIHINNVESVENSDSSREYIVDNLKIKEMIKFIEDLIDNTRFEYLYVEESKLFSIGFNVEENQLTPSYYDLLASEARQASYVAIAKKDIPSKHWNALSRTLTTLKKYKGLVSWSGTAFEYLMPSINMPSPEGSLINESIKFSIMSQREYSKKLGIPWGMSEAAFSLRDLNNNYQYKAFGIPWLGIKRGLADEIVVSSYGTILAISELPKEVINNLKQLESQGMYNKYGFYESIDYTPTRLKKGENHAIVKTYMAHHQGLILLAMNNFLNEQILQKRFMENPELKAIDILLQERMPENVLITKEKKEKIEKIKNIDYEAYSVREYSKISEDLNNINVISNDNYTIVIDQKGKGYSKYGDILINRYKITDEEEQGIFFFLRNIKTKRVWTSAHMNYLSKPDKYNVVFTPDMSKFVRRDGNIESTTQVWVTPNNPVEIRRIELKNDGLTEETIEITSMLEPILSTASQDYSHKAFNNLFISYEFLEDTNTLLIKRNKRTKGEEDIYLAVNLYTENETIGEIEFEIDKERFVGRGNLGLPKAIEKGIPLGRKLGMTVEQIVAMKRTAKIMPNESLTISLIMAVSKKREEAIGYIKEYMNNEKIERNIELAKVKVEAENMYLSVKRTEINVYQKMLSYLLFHNPLKEYMYTQNIPELAPVSELWKYGISGDLPILLIKIKDVNDIYVVREAIKAYEYFRVKNIQVDLVIINEEKRTYDNYVQEEVQNCILDRGFSYLQNVKGGIFVLNNLDKISKNVIEYRASLLINSSLGSIGRQLKDYEEEYIEKNKKATKEINTIYVEDENIRENLEDKNLKYYNEYGGFSADGKEYLIRVNKDERLPTVWSNILANENFGTVVTENMGGYTWHKNSRLNRLTAWNNNQVVDVPSEIIFLRDMENKKTWSLGLNPMPDNNDYYITYGFGYSKYQHISNGIVQKLDVFVPRNDSIKVQILHLENIQTKKKKIKLIYYIKPVLGEDETKTTGFIQTKYKENANLVTLENTISESEQSLNSILYISSSEKINSYTGRRKSFIGSQTLANPEAIQEFELDKLDGIRL